MRVPGAGGLHSRWGVANDRRYYADLVRPLGRCRGVHRQLSMACLRRS
jgi:hypothetical protein